MGANQPQLDARRRELRLQVRRGVLVQLAAVELVLNALQIGGELLNLRLLRLVLGEDLAALGESSRSVLYAELAKHAANEYQRDPVFILGGDVKDWLMDCGLNDPQKELFQKLLWKRGEALVFSDIQALLTLARNSEEVRITFRALTRVRSLVVELHLPHRLRDVAVCRDLSRLDGRGQVNVRENDAPEDRAEEVGVLRQEQDANGGIAFSHTGHHCT